MAVSKLDFTNKAGLDTWFGGLAHEGIILEKLFTNSPALISTIIGSQQWKPGEKKYNDSIIAKLMREHLKFCAPIYECAWTSCNGTVNRGLQWFEKNKDLPVMEWHQKYEELKARLPTPEEVRQYQQAALKWRSDTGYFINQFTEASTDSVMKVYSVTSRNVTDIRQILEDMVRRRKEALGIKDNEAVRAPAEHAKPLSDWVLLGDWTAPCPWGDWWKENQKGHKLAATGLASAIQRGYIKKAEAVTKLGAMAVAARAGMTVGDYDTVACGKLAQLFKDLPGEAEVFLSGAVNSDGFVQQGSALDSVFSSFYWAWKAGVTLRTFPSLSNMLYQFGFSDAGKAKLTKQLKASPFKWAQNFPDLFSTLQEEPIHMHPGVLTAGRMDDMTACFGAFPVSEPSKMINGGFSKRYILNLRTDGNNPSADTVVNLFKEYTIGYPEWKSEPIVPIEHLLHQTFLSKAGPFVNVFQVTGNALNVQITGDLSI